MKIATALLFLLIMGSLQANASSFKHLNRNIHTDDMPAAPLNKIRSMVKADKTDVRNAQIIDEARKLEAVLISTMVDPMFPDGKESDLYGGGPGSDVYRMMMVQEYGKILSKSNGLGVAEGIAKDLINK